jgi:hypothetical protein
LAERSQTYDEGEKSLPTKSAARRAKKEAEIHRAAGKSLPEPVKAEGIFATQMMGKVGEG